MQLTIKLVMPEPGIQKPEKKQAEKQYSIEDEVRDSIALVESDRDSSIEWKALRQLACKLEKAKQTPRVINLRKMLQPVLSKYGYNMAAPLSTKGKK